MITTETMTYEDMKQAVHYGYLCAKCQGRLVIAWGGAYNVNGYILRCGNDINHEGITLHDKEYEQKIKEGFSMESNALMTMDEAKMLQRVEMARFPQDLTKDDKKLLAQVAITYGFDPLMGEVTIYQGKPFVSIDGRYRKAQETNRLDGVETRPATKKEREDWQIPDGDYFFRAEVYVKDALHAFVGWGRVCKVETVGGKGYKPVEKNPQRMAEKRAEAQALRKAFHIPLPSVEEIGSQDYESTAIDITTGEITKPETSLETLPEAPESKSKPVEEETSPVVLPEPTAAPPSDIVIDMDWFKESLKRLHWSEAIIKSYCSNSYKVSKEGSLEEVIVRLNPEQRTKLVKEVKERLKMLY